MPPRISSPSDILSSMLMATCLKPPIIDHQNTSDGGPYLRWHCLKAARWWQQPCPVCCISSIRYATLHLFLLLWPNFRHSPGRYERQARSKSKMLSSIHPSSHHPPLPLSLFECDTTAKNPWPDEGQKDKGVLRAKYQTEKWRLKQHVVVEV